MGLSMSFERETAIDYNTFATGCLIAGIIGLLIWIGCLVASIIIMKRKGRSAGLGFVFGFFLGWIGLIIVLCMKPVRR